MRRPIKEIIAGRIEPGTDLWRVLFSRENEGEGERGKEVLVKKEVRVFQWPPRVHQPGKP